MSHARDVLLFLTAFAGCGSDAGIGDRRSCGEAVEEYRQVIASLDTSCDVDTDCTYVNSPDTCECETVLPGGAVNAAAAAAASDQLADLALEIGPLQAWDCFSNPCGLQCGCDAGEYVATCANHQCGWYQPPFCK
jgi:hypothetical protein